MSLLTGGNRIDEMYIAQRTISSVGSVYGNNAAGTGLSITLNTTGMTTNSPLGLFSGCLIFSAEL